MSTNDKLSINDLMKFVKSDHIDSIVSSFMSNDRRNEQKGMSNIRSIIIAYRLRHLIWTKIVALLLDSQPDSQTKFSDVKDLRLRLVTDTTAYILSDGMGVHGKK